jgi:hypothetical protein
MNTYQVSYFPQGFTATQTVTVQAVDFVFTDLFVLFMDTAKTTVLAVPLNLDPVITRTVTG